MSLNPYIAIFLTVVFFGKFLVMDSKILVVILDKEEIAYVNPFCKKQNSELAGSSDQKSMAKDSKTLNLFMDTFCNAPFQFDIFNWEYRIISDEFMVYAYNTPSVPEPNQARFYPPPKA